MVTTLEYSLSQTDAKNTRWRFNARESLVPEEPTGVGGGAEEAGLEAGRSPAWPLQSVLSQMFTVSLVQRRVAR